MSKGRKLRKPKELKVERFIFRCTDAYGPPQVCIGIFGLTLTEVRRLADWLHRAAEWIEEEKPK